ncbi:hypothetical protein CQA44_12375, partial [Helicobacter sp. MIT 14-3879]
ESFFKYKSSFYLSFISNKDSLSDEYLQARKDLYKSVTKIREEQLQRDKEEIENLEQALQGLDSKQREVKLKELQRKQEKELKDKQRQARFNNNENSYLLESQDKNNIIIFLDKINPKDLENKNIYSN